MPLNVPPVVVNILVTAMLGIVDGQVNILLPEEALTFNFVQSWNI